jgi:VIT1/CCC1 family predicted Fe2+/Mn2+ transporter
MRPILSASKVRGISAYSGKAMVPAGHPWPKTVEDVGGGHRTFGGGTLRAGVFGVNDGLVSNTCLVMGVAGAAAEHGVFVLTGVAGLLAGTFSMSAGEFISMLSQRVTGGGIPWLKMALSVKLPLLQGRRLDDG